MKAESVGLAAISPTEKIIVPIIVNHTLLNIKVSVTPIVPIIVPRIIALTCVILVTK